MNANELAEILESDSKHTSGRFTYSSRYIADIATMLRQQQAEIEALNEERNRLWKDKLHPIKELTDEEIEEVTNTIEWRESDWLWELDFARAILRKAQNK